MKVLSLFDGISCGQLALKNLGINTEVYYASEIDKSAVSMTKRNFPDTVQLGNVTEIDGKDLDIDLLLAGSPCQGFSLAGKQLNFQDGRSKLFFEFLRLLEETKPKYFLLENVLMKQEYQDIISSYLGVAPQRIDSSYFSAQSRVRLYWTNIPLRSLISCSTLRIKDILMDQPLSLANTYKDIRIDSYSSKRGIKVLGGIVKDGTKTRVANPTTSSHFSCNQRLYDAGYKSPCLLTGYSYWIQDDTVRQLSIGELELLQGLPLDYTFGTKRARLKAIGNGWQIDTIKYILSGLTPILI